MKNPFYSLWINSEQELGLSLVPDQLIYVVPNNQSLTSYVFTAELMKYVLVCVCVCLGVYSMCVYMCVSGCMHFVHATCAFNGDYIL